MRKTSIGFSALLGGLVTFITPSQSLAAHSYLTLTRTQAIHPVCARKRAIRLRKSTRHTKQPATAEKPQLKMPPTTNTPAVVPAAALHQSVAREQKDALQRPAPEEVWSEIQVIAGLQECLLLFAPISASLEVLQPIRNGQCGTPAPVRLSRLGAGPGVELSPPAVINCRVGAKLHDWIQETLQPAATQMLNSPIRRLVTLSSYDCRERVGTSNTRLSEHAFANAIDIAAVVTADGRTIDILTKWGPTVRDLRPQAKNAGSTPEGQPDRPPSLTRKEAASGKKTEERRTAVDADPRTLTAEAAFLRRLHRGACGTFGTVLGPEANEAHRNHLHLDLAARRHSAFCE